MNVTDSAQSGGSYCYFITYPLAARVMLFGLVAFNYAIFFCSVPLQENSLFWFLWIWGMLLWAMPLVVAIQPRKLRGRVQFTSKEVIFTPNLFMRQLEPSIAISIGDEASEILICRGSQDTYPWSLSDRKDYPKGFRILLRSANGRDRELKVETGDRLNARQAKMLSNGIAASARLPVRFVRREIASGSVREIPWSPGERT